MGFLDKVKDLAAQNADKVEAAIEKVGDIVDEKTEGKFSGVVDKAVVEKGDIFLMIGENKVPFKDITGVENAPVNNNAANSLASLSTDELADMATQAANELSGSPVDTNTDEEAPVEEATPSDEEPAAITT